MSVSPENYEAETPQPEYSGPTIDLAVGERTYELTWHNTIVRTFTVGDGMYDHAIHKMPDGQLVAFSLRQENLQEIVTLLEEAQFPRRIDPYLDEPTLNWYTSIEASDMDSELEQLFSAE